MALITVATSVALATSSSGTAAADAGPRTEALGATTSAPASASAAGALAAGSTAAAGPFGRPAAVASAVAAVVEVEVAQGSPAAARDLPRAASRGAAAPAAATLSSGLAAARHAVARTAVETAKARATSWAAPMSSSRVNSTFGQRWGRLHAGLDLDCEVGDPVRALSGGTVTFAGVQGGYGNKVEVTFWDGTLAYFGHLSAIDVTEGDRVSRGDLLGKCGNTGRSTGPHLHLEIHPDGGETPVDPTPWLKAHGIR